MAAKPHHDFWGWASDHWFLTFLLAWTAVSLPGAIVAAARPQPPQPPQPPRLPAGGQTPFPGSLE